MLRKFRLQAPQNHIYLISLCRSLDHLYNLPPLMGDERSNRLIQSLSEILNLSRSNVHITVEQVLS